VFNVLRSKLMAAFGVAALFLMGGNVFATESAPVLPDINLDTVGFVTTAGTAIGALLVAVIGLAIVVWVAKKLLRFLGLVK